MSESSSLSAPAEMSVMRLIVSNEGSYEACAVVKICGSCVYASSARRIEKYARQWGCDEI